jgi:hypothetical protein
MMFSANEGAFDRLLRTLLGVVLLIFGWGISGVTGTVMIVLSVVMFATAAAGVCPLYALVGVNTQNKEFNEPAS